MQLEKIQITKRSKRQFLLCYRSMCTLSKSHCLCGFSQLFPIYRIHGIWERSGGETKEWRWSHICWWVSIRPIKLSPGIYTNYWIFPKWKRSFLRDHKVFSREAGRLSDLKAIRVISGKTRTGIQSPWSPVSGLFSQCCPHCLLITLGFPFQALHEYDEQRDKTIWSSVVSQRTYIGHFYKIL